MGKLNSYKKFVNITGNRAVDIGADETAMVLEDGATEIDMVINVGAVKSGMWKYVYDDNKGKRQTN